jgi:hypothetical protein
MLSAYCTIACTLVMQPCPAALPGSLALQHCQAALPASLAEKFASFFTAVGRHACSIAYFVYKLILPCEGG